MLQFGPTATHSEQAIALMTDASFGAVGYAVLIEDDPNQKFLTLRKSYAPMALWFKNFHPSADKNVCLCQGIPCNLFCIQRIWGYFLACA